MKNTTSENPIWPIIYENISIFEIMFFAIFLYLTYLSARDLKYAKATQLWPKAKGKVQVIESTKRHLEDHLEITCEYQVNGEKYSTKKIFIDEYLSDISEIKLPPDDLNEPPPLRFARLMKKIINGKISNVTLCIHYIISCFPVFPALRTEFISNFQPGYDIQIYYAPGNPEVAIIKPGASTPFLIILGLSIFLTLVNAYNMIAGILHAFGISSELLNMISYFIVFLWCVGPLCLFLYLTGMADTILKSIK